mgnify:CR=1 FL=1
MTIYCNTAHMTESLKRRLDALIVLCSTLLGLALTVLFFWERASVPFFLIALLPSGSIAVGAFLYVLN